MSKIDSSLFNAQEHALDKEFRLCPECGGSLSLRKSKHGLFLGCENYPTCQYMRPLQQHSVLTEKVLEDSCCPECQHIETNSPLPDMASELPACPSCHHGQLQAKTSRYGKTFYACSDYPQCKYAINDKPVAKACPQCGFAILIEKRTRQGVRFCCPQKSCNYSDESL